MEQKTYYVVVWEDIDDMSSDYDEFSNMEDAKNYFSEVVARNPNSCYLYEFTRFTLEEFNKDDELT